MIDMAYPELPDLTYKEYRDLKPPTDSELKQAAEEARLNGMPRTPARWQRIFGWSYSKSLAALEVLR